MTLGRLDDIVTTYRLAMDHMYEPSDRLILFKNGMHSRAIGRKGELHLGFLDGVIVGIGGADPPQINPEQVLPEWRQDAERFFDPEKNPLTYFQRMIMLKELLNEEGIPLQEMDIMPKYPHHYYPSVVGMFESKPGDLAFQYIGVDTDRHMRRVLAKGPDERNITTLYENFRENKNIRDTPIDINPREFDERVYDFYMKRFRPEADGTFGERVEGVIDKVLEESQRSGNEPVFGILCFPRQVDRDQAAARWKRPYDEVMTHNPFDTYMLLKEALVRRGVDLSKVHITFTPPDLPFGNEPSRADSYLPRRYRLITETPGDNPILINKAERLGNHPNRVGDVIYV